MAEVKVTLVDDIDNTKVPGAIEYRLKYQSDEIAGIGFICPCGCGREGWLPFRPETSPAWEWNGNKEKPTLRPSVLQVGGCRWHGFLTDGVWRSC